MRRIKQVVFFLDTIKGCILIDNMQVFSIVLKAEADGAIRTNYLHALELQQNSVTNSSQQLEILISNSSFLYHHYSNRMVENQIWPPGY